MHDRQASQPGFQVQETKIAALDVESPLISRIHHRFKAFTASDNSLSAYADIGVVGSHYSNLDGKWRDAQVDNHLMKLSRGPVL